jgi:hypothetical protein
MARRRERRWLCTAWSWVIVFSSSTGCDDGPDLPTERVSSRFTFSTDAFSFPNFGGIEHGSVVSPDHLARMFGKDEVCIPGGDTCRLTPIAKEYLRAVNDTIRGGRCEGFAVLSGLASLGEVALDPFGAASARALSLEDNRPLGAELAYWYATQFLRDVVPRTTLPTTAQEALTTLHDEFRTPQHPMYRIGMARLDETTGALSGGHAILATSVAPSSSPGRYVIGVYDNNHPEAERQIEIDLEHNRWSYQASSNPDDPTTLYSGDTTNQNPLYLAVVEPRQGVHACTFCSLDADDEQDVAQLFGSASAEVVAVHPSGARVGEQGGRHIDEHAEGHVLPSFTAACHDCRDSSHVVVPHDPSEGVVLEIRQAPHAPVEEGQLVPTDARYFGHGFAVTIEGADVDEDDTVHLLDVEARGDDVTFTTSPAEADDVAILSLAVEVAELEQLFIEVKLQGTEVARLHIDPDSGNPTIEIEGATASETTRVRVTEHIDDTLRTFSVDVPLPPGARAQLVLTESVVGGDVVVLLDLDDDGVFEETRLLPDLALTTDEL